MTVAQLLEKLKQAPPEAEVLIYRGGAYSGAHTIDIDVERKQVWVSSEMPTEDVWQENTHT